MIPFSANHTDILTQAAFLFNHSGFHLMRKIYVAWTEKYITDIALWLSCYISHTATPVLYNSHKPGFSAKLNVPIDSHLRVNHVFLWMYRNVLAAFFLTTFLDSP